MARVTKHAPCVKYGKSCGARQDTAGIYLPLTSSASLEKMPLPFLGVLRNTGTAVAYKKHRHIVRKLDTKEGKGTIPQNSKHSWHTSAFAQDLH